MTETVESRPVKVPEPNFRQRLWLAMDTAEITGLELADRLMVARQSVSHWVTGKHRPRRRDIAAIAEECNVPYEWLANGASSTTHNPDDGGNTDQSDSTQSMLCAVSESFTAHNPRDVTLTPLTNVDGPSVQEIKDHFLKEIKKLPRGNPVTRSTPKRDQTVETAPLRTPTGKE